MIGMCSDTECKHYLTYTRVLTRRAKRASRATNNYHQNVNGSYGR